MAKSLLSKLGKATATGLTALALATGIGVGKARATPANWSSFSEIVPEATGESITYTSNSSIPLLNNLAAICYMIDPMDNTAHVVGGFDMENGVVVRSYFNRDWNQTTGYGLNNGDTANTASNSGNTYDIFYEVFYDIDGDGFGPIVGGLPGSYSDILASTQYSISNFSSYGSENPGNFTFAIPEGNKFDLALLGTAALLAASRPRRRNNSKDSSQISN